MHGCTTSCWWIPGLQLAPSSLQHRHGSGASWACSSGKSSHSPTKDVHWGSHLTSHWSVSWRKVPLVGRLPLKDLYGPSLPLVANACCSEGRVFLLRRCSIFRKRRILFLLLRVNRNNPSLVWFKMQGLYQRLGREEHIFSPDTFPLKVISWCCPKDFPGI